MKKQYSWRAGVTSGFYKRYDANAVGLEIEEIGDNVTADQVVQRATDVNSAMHEIFEWDNTKAGHLWRKQQAANLLCSLQVEYVSEDEEKIKEPITVRAYVGIKQKQGYHKIETVVEDLDLYADLLNKAYNELKAIRNKYKNLGEIQEKLAFLDEE